MKEKFIIAGLIFFIFFINGCAGNAVNSVELMKADKITYRFQDSSVPPEYHRSYTINVTKTKAQIIVDSYGNVINRAEVKLKEGQFREILEAIDQGKINIRSDSKDDSGCTGGTSEGLKVSEKQAMIIDGTTYNCGRESFGNLSGDLAIVSEKLKSLFPDFEKLLKR